MTLCCSVVVLAIVPKQIYPVKFIRTTNEQRDERLTQPTRQPYKVSRKYARNSLAQKHKNALPTPGS